MVVFRDVDKCTVSWLRSQVHMFHCPKGGVSVASHAVSGSIMLHVWMVSPTVGKFLVVIPSAVQVSRLRKSLSESLVTYKICRFRGLHRMETCLRT